jgi:hypothetical protein
LTTSTPPAPSSREEVLARYREEIANHQRLCDALEKKRSRAVAGIGAAIAALVYLTLHAVHASTPGWEFTLALAALVGLIWYYLRVQPMLTRSQRLRGFYEVALARADGSAPQSGRTGTEAGQELRQPGHLYDRELDILGDNSLFGLLATVRTGPGERGLARYLLSPATHEESLARQQAVKELLPQTGLREEIALIGATSFHQISASFFDEWIDEPAPYFPPAFRVVLLITAVCNVALLLTGLTHLRPWGFIFPNLALTLGIQGSVSLYLRSRVLPLLTGGARLQHHVRLFSDGLALLQGASFTGPKLRELQRQALQPAGAVKLLKQLESQLAIVEQRPKEYFLLVSLLVAAGTQAAISIAKWKRANSAAMKQWLAVWAEFEALNAIATYAFENPEDTWPELLPPTHAPTFRATELGHPLLENSVTNDIELGPGRQFYLISGSNMAGKSTLLRSIGINAVLAYAGAPVRAASLALTPLALGASLALTDSLAEGRSKFLAEVERLSAVVRLSAASPLLFLVDEIFSGTNSEDRRTAARAVLETLLAQGAIGALSTHDLALTALANTGNTGLNVHMASPNPEDPLAFDYKLKPGVNTASSALAIVRMMGLEA